MGSDIFRTQRQQLFTTHKHRTIYKVTSTCILEGLEISVVTWFKDHGICKLCINYSLATCVITKKRYCLQYMNAIVVLKSS